VNDIPKLPGIVGARPSGVVPTSFEEIWRMGNMLSQTKMVPEAFQGKPNDCTAALMYGLELGLSPMAAMQSIAVINGKPSLYGDGMIAVVRASGTIEWMKETDDGSTATCTVKRRGEPDPVTRTFSQEDAKRAQLAGKGGPWTQYPQRMRAMRARSWALRDTFADVLRGIASAEEMQDVAEMKDITPAPAAPLLEIPDIPDGTDEPTPQTDAEFLEQLRKTVARHKNEAGALDEIWGHWREEIGERGLEQEAADIVDAARGEAVEEPDSESVAPTLSASESLDIPWEETPAEPANEAVMDGTLSKKLAAYQTQLQKAPNPTLLKEVARGWQAFVDGLGARDKAQFQSVYAQQLARVKAAQAQLAR